MWAVVIRVLISWVSPNPRNPVVQFLAKVTDPALNQVRRLLPLNYGGIDFSPVIFLLLIVFANDFIVTSLKGLAQGMPAAGILPIFLISLIRLVQGILFAFMIIVIVRAVLSWISPDPYNPVVRFVYGITEPVLYRLRSTLPMVFGGIDISPVVLIIALYFINSLLDRLLFFAGRLLN
jgi:YggT family protein